MRAPDDRPRTSSTAGEHPPHRRRRDRAAAEDDHQGRALAPQRPVRDPARHHLRRLGRPRLQPLARDGRRGRIGPGRLHPARGRSPASSRARSRWRPASTSRCRASASCSSARSSWSARSSRRCPRRSSGARGASTSPRASRARRRTASRPACSATRQTALDTLVREELGLDPDELGSPWGAALGSFLAFAVGAVIPVIPYLFGSGSRGVRAEPRPEPRRAVRRRRGRQPAHGQGHAVQRPPPDGHRRRRRGGHLRRRQDHRRGGRGVSDAASLAARLRAEGLDAGTLVERAARPLRAARARLRQGARVRVGLDPVRAARARRVTVDLALGDRLDLPAGTRHDAVVGPRGRHLPRGARPGRDASTALRRPAPPGTW